LGRGIHLLNFMERRWQLSMGTLQEKKEILGLEFLSHDPGAAHRRFVTAAKGTRLPTKT